MTVRIGMEDVAFEYPDGTRALDGVNLMIEPGARLAIIGQNGSGKSTLARHLNGLLRPTRGRVTFDGRDVADRHVAELARTVGLAFQNPDRQIFAGSVGAEVAFGPRNLGRRGEEVDAAVEQALLAVGLEADGSTNPYDLGFSRRKLLSLGSILAMETPIVVLDEPTTGQDARGVLRIQAIVDDLAVKGRTVVAISHDLRFVAESFERVAVMREGRLLLDASPTEVFGQASWPVLVSTYLEPPFASRVGVRLGLPPTPTEQALVQAIAARAQAG